MIEIFVCLGVIVLCIPYFLIVKDLIKELEEEDKNEDFKKW